MGNNLTIKGGGLSQAAVQALIDATAAPLVHAARHQDAGADEISVQGLSGVLTAEQLSSWAGVSGKPTTFTPSAHKASHEDAGADEISVQGLSGVLTAEQLSLVRSVRSVSFAGTQDIGTTFADVTDLSITITPASASSKFLLIALLNTGLTNVATNAMVRFLRDATPIGVGAAAGSRTQTTSAMQSDSSNSGSGGYAIHALFLDSPATASQIVYKLQARAASFLLKVNYTANDSNDTSHPRCVSTFCLIELSS